MRFDVARYMWLHVHGGVYADLDVQCTSPMEPHIGTTHAVLLVGNDTAHAHETGCTHEHRAHLAD